MKAAFLIICLLMAGMLVCSLSILAECQPDILETSTNISGSGLIALDGPGDYRLHGWAVCQNWTVGFCLNETAFERRI